MSENRKLSKQEYDNWWRIVENLKKISELADQCQLILFLDMNIKVGKPVEEIGKLIDTVSGMSYMFTPQTEWLGSESFCQRPPHIDR